MAKDDNHILIHGLLDQELDLETATLLEQQIKLQPALASEYEAAAAVKSKLEGLPMPGVSEDFLNRISNMQPPPQVRSQMFEGWQRLAASLVFAAALSSGITYAMFARPAGFDTADAVAASHRRSLLAASPIDVASSDSHTVKPWLDARIGVSPPAIDMKTDGFALLGGRVDVIGDRTMPTLVYQHKEHLISVVAGPLRFGDAALVAPQHLNAGGMNMVQMSESGFAYWVVSDMEWKTLDEFVADYRSKTGGLTN